MRIFPYIFLLLFVFACIGSLQSQVEQDRRHNRRYSQEMKDRQLAYQYYHQKEYEKAVVIFEKLFKNNSPLNYYTVYLNCLIELNRLDKAEDIIKEQIRRQPGYYRFHIDLGYVYELQDKKRKAARQYNEVIEKLPANQNMISQIANSFLIRNKNDLAVSTLKKGQEIIGNENIFKIDLGNIYYRTGNFSLMIKAYLDYLAYDPSQAPRVKNRLQLIISTGAGEGIKEILQKDLLSRTQQNPEIRIYPELLYWLSIQDGDYEFAIIQAKSIDKRFDQDGSLVFDLAQLSVNNKNFQTGIEAFNYVIKEYGRQSPFYYKSRLGLLNARFGKLTVEKENTFREIRNLVKDYEKTLEEMGKHPESIRLMRNLAHIKAYYLDELEEAASLLENSLEVPNTSEMEKAKSKLKLADVYLFMNEVWEATLLYSQVEKAFKNDPIGHEAKFRNAKLFYYIGQFEWAGAKLDVLRAATSKLIANDAMQLSLLISDNVSDDSISSELQQYALADMLAYQGKKDSAMILLDSLENNIQGYHNIMDELIFKKAVISEELGLYNQADSLYAVVSANYSFDILCDDALYKRAQLNETKLNNVSKAMELYEMIFTGYPDSVYSVDARKRYRKLRGDPVNN